MAENQPSAVEWNEDAKPLTICMNCNTEFPESESVCPKCNLKLLVVHRCPRCSRIAALKHLRCPYCAQLFVKGDELETALEPESSPAAVPEGLRTEAAHQRHQRKVLFSVLGAFVAVLAGAALVLHYQSSRSPVATTLGRSFVLRVVDVRHSASEQTFTTGKLAAGAVVEITAVKQDERGGDWYEIRHNDGLGYVRVNDLAPPKGATADSGYQLLTASLANLNDPAEAGDATQAIDLYRRLYPSDPRGQELLWQFAGRAWEMASRSRSREMISVARKSYQELVAANGEYSARAREALKQLPEAPMARVSPAPAAPDGMEVIGASTVGPAESRQTLPHKVMLLNQTRVLVSLPGAGLLQPGQVLLAHVANDVTTNNEVAVPAGSACLVKVTATNDSNTARQGLVSLQLLSLQVGKRSYAVDALPVQLPASELALKAGSPVLFRLRRSLVLSR